MVELKIYLNNDLNERFREIAMNVFGYGRGSLSRAAEEALTKWCAEHAKSSGQNDAAKAPDGHAESSSARINPDERESKGQNTTPPR